MIEDPSFWVGLGFILFCALTFKPVRHYVVTALDQYIDTIRAKIDNAAAGKSQAQQALDNCQHNQILNAQQIEAINTHSQAEIARLMQQSQKDMQQYFVIEERLFMDRMRELEQQMLKNIEQQSLKIAIATCQVLLQHSSGQDYHKRFTEQTIATIAHT